MKWLTKTEIAKRAKKSYKEALIVSIEHHQQIATATRKEFFEGVGAKKVTISSDHCGVCQAQAKEDCEGCFLKKEYGEGCGSHWQKIHKAIDAILIGKPRGEPSWATVVIAEKNMIKRLKRELRKQGTK
jgi:hypothetical protein